MSLSVTPPPGMRPKAAGRHAETTYLHHESAGTGTDQDPRWEPVGPADSFPTDAECYAMQAPIPQRMVFDRNAPTIMDVFSTPDRLATAAASRITGQDGGGYTSTSTPANNWW